MVLMVNLHLYSVAVRDQPSKNESFSADTVNVKTFGARGDGVQNDSAAFQKAIIYASGARKVLLVPKGIYKISNLVVYPNSKIVGVRGSSVLVLTNGTQNNRQCFLLTDVSKNILISNIAFDANGKNNAGKNIFCIKSTLSPKGSINNLTIQNCSFTGSKNYGSVFLIGPTDHITNVVIFNCLFNNLGSSAVSVRGINGLTFNSNTVTNWDLLDKINAAFSFQSQVCSNIVFRNNYFKNKDAAYFAVECAGTCLNHGVFTGNTFDGNGYDASGISGVFNNCLFKDNKHLNGGGTHRSGYELVGDNDTLTNNVIEHGSIQLGAGTPNIAYAAHTGSGYIVTGNRITGNYGTNNLCLSIGGFDTVKSAWIEHNIFDNHGGKGNAPVIEIGQRGPAKNVTIQNNQLLGSPGNSCIRMKVSAGNHYSENIMIRKNTITGENGIQVYDMPVWKGVKISENDFTGISGSVFMKTSGFSSEFHLEKNKSLKKLN